MKTIILITMLVLSISAFAGTGHQHGHSHGGHGHASAISKEKTGEVGRQNIERLVKSKKLGASWKTAVFDKSEKKSFKGSKQWVVTFKNEKGVKGKKLFIFLKESGEFVAANFTGK